MKQVAKDWKELNYFHKTGKYPTPAKQKISKWQLVYGKPVLADNVPYAQLMNFKKLYSRMGVQFPNKDLLKIIPAP